jgi:hypothetical protein
VAAGAVVVADGVLAVVAARLQRPVERLQPVAERLPQLEGAELELVAVGGVVEQRLSRATPARCLLTVCRLHLVL